MKTKMIILLLAIAGIMTGCAGSDDGLSSFDDMLVKNTVELIPFDEITVGSGIQLVMENGSRELTVESSQWMSSYVNVSVQNRHLQLSIEGITPTAEDIVSIYVSEEMINSVTLADNSQVEILHTLVADDFTIRGSGTSKITGTIECDNLIVDVTDGVETDITVYSDNVNITSGGADQLKLKGQTETLIASLSDNTSLYTSGLTSGTVNIDSPGNAY